MAEAEAPLSEPLPLVTVSLVTYDGRAWLPGCLDSVSRQLGVQLEILILDNGSSDGSTRWLRERVASDPRMEMHESPVNLGFAVAHDRNLLRARGEFVLLLNQDVELDDAFLSRVIAAFRSDARIAAVQGRVRRLGAGGERLDTLDTTGLVMLRDRRAISRAQGLQDGPDHASAGSVWGVDGPVPVYRRAALEDARLPASTGGWEILDEDFFMYKEDVDLAWRLRLLGWRAWYEPSALAWHARGTGATGATAFRDIARANRSISRSAGVLSWRNQRLMQVKNERPSAFLKDLPWIARREVLSWLFILLYDVRRLSAVVPLVRLLPATVRKRRYLHARVRQRGGDEARSDARSAGS